VTHSGSRAFFDGEIAVLSPHLDDAALSLGGSIARATRNGSEVRIITVFAYDPNHDGPPGQWDEACGFTSAEEAAQVRRAADARACEILGATPVWLPFGDVEYSENRHESGIWAAVTEAVGEARVVLVPGFPLAAPDHRWLTQLILRRPVPSTRTALYVEQPYAAWRRMGLGGRAGAEGLSPWSGVTNSLRIALRTPGARQLQEPHLPKEVSALVAQSRWIAASTTRSDRHAKWQAIAEFRSQVANFGPLVVRRIALYEGAWGGEGLAWAAPGGSARVGETE
jgi:LmbE family N-acetylglucosaminyl deacetylase